MTGARKGDSPPDEDVIFLEEGAGEDVARAVEDAVRAVTAVEERHRRHGSEAGKTAVREAAREKDEKEEVEKEEGEKEKGDHVEAPRASLHADLLALQEERLAQLSRELDDETERADKAMEAVLQLREALLRKGADLENVKRRTEKDKAEHFRFALAETFRDLLGVVDNFERALEHVPDGMSGTDFSVGVAMIARQLTEVLRKYGLAEVAAEGLPFDPNVHEAVVREETDKVPPGTVLAVFQRGYSLNDKLLRPAMVKVSAAPTSRENGNLDEQA